MTNFVPSHSIIQAPEWPVWFAQLMAKGAIIPSSAEFLDLGLVEFEVFQALAQLFLVDHRCCSFACAASTPSPGMTDISMPRW